MSARTFGATPVEGGVRFALYAPTARQVDLMLEGEPRPMRRDERGLFALFAADARAGARYRFRIDGDLLVPDPASRFQPDGIDAEGVVVDPAVYRWRAEWSGRAWNGRPWREAVIWEAHVGTATPDGTYAALADRLPALADLGVTAIELMPLADCPGDRNWGYDGVLLYAPNPAYGTPDDLRALVDRAHSLGIMVLLDVVYNHFGPSGNYLHAYAKSFFTDRHPTPWGAGVNVDGADSALVRRFFAENAASWIEDFRFDGLRLDAVHAIRDDSAPHVLLEIADAARAAAGARPVHLVLENEDNASHWLERQGGAARRFTAQWNDDIHHCLHVLVTGEQEGYYADFAKDTVASLARALTQGFVYQGDASGNLGRSRGEPSAHLPPDAFVSFLQNHDQIGNRAFGDRIGALTSAAQVRFAHAVLLLAPQIPMLFMGEEWDASTPFQYFVDFADDPDLSKAVRDGRRREFARFAAYGDPERVPDPTARDTFERSKLRWDERESGAHAEALAWTKTLLAVRARHVVPLLAGEWRGADATRTDARLDVVWRFSTGELRMVADCGAAGPAVDAADWTEIFATSAHPEWSVRAYVRAARD